MADVILETTFLVDLEREIRRGEAGPAQVFLQRRARDRLYLTFTIVGELAAGASLAERQDWLSFTAPFQILESNPDVCWRYGESYRYLKDNGVLIGSNDLWIAATALAYGMPVVTANENHYRRVPGLRVLSYREPPN